MMTRLWKGKPRTVPLPKTREPFVNIPLKPLGFDQQGNEQFWTSSVNQLFGSKHLVVNEWGACRIYPTNLRHKVLYSCGHDGDTLWLCGALNYIVSLNLKTGKVEEFPTGVKHGRVFPGGAFDPATGKFFVQCETGVVFDTRAKKVVKVIANCCRDGVSRFSFPNGDGTYSMVSQIPGEEIVHWDPATDKTERINLQDDPVFTQDGREKLTCRLVSDASGRWYFPRHGWFNPRTRQFEAGPKPSEEMTWFARRDNLIYGARCRSDGLGDSAIHVWNLNTGSLRYLLQIPDGDVFGINLTESGKIIAVNVFGYFYRFDAATGALELSKPLPVDEHGVNDAFCRIDRDRVLGAPYIASQFWELNLRTKKGFNCGRAHSGWGEICHALTLNGKVYLTAYTSGELLEYNPSQPPHFPMNPRVVADPPLGMRPVAITHDGRNVFYSCSNDYGRLGSVVTRYDTKTGRAIYAQNPVTDQQIQSLVYAQGSLLCGTTPHGDCNSALGAPEFSCIARLDAKDLTLQEQVAVEDSNDTRILGALDGRRWVCLIRLKQPGAPSRIVILDRRDLAGFTTAERKELPLGFNRIDYTGKPGKFILNIEDRLEVWDLKRGVSLGYIFRPFDTANIDGYHIFVDTDTVFVMRSRELIVLEGCLKGI